MVYSFGLFGVHVTWCDVYNIIILLREETSFSSSYEKRRIIIKLISTLSPSVENGYTIQLWRSKMWYFSLLCYYRFQELERDYRRREHDLELQLKDLREQAKQQHKTQGKNSSFCHFLSKSKHKKTRPFCARTMYVIGVVNFYS